MSKPRPIFAEMPWHIKQKVLESTDFKTRCRLRKCSKSLKNLVDQTVWKRIDWLSIILSKDRVSLSFSVWKGEIGDGWKGFQENYKINYFKKSKRMDRNNHIERAIIDFTIILKSPKTRVRHLIMTNDLRPNNRHSMNQKMTFMQCFNREMSKLQHQLNVEWFKCGFELNGDELSRILLYLNPQTIKRIGLKALNKEQEMSRVIGLEQWKNAENLLLENLSRIPINCLMSFSSIEVKLMEYTTEHLKTIIQKFSTSVTSQYMLIVQPRLAPDFMTYIIRNFEQWNQNVYHVMCFPNTPFFLEISFANGNIRFLKLAKRN